MKILPDYIIEYMPELEEAIEEVRLSVIDHAYEIMKCLDIDELTSDEIRHKLELYDIKVEDMTDNWLPNGRFYRMYPSIKHHRTRQNALSAIAKSGGQFEGVWSTGFAKKSEYNFKSIQVLRHYEIGSDMDGYFYISGNTSRHSDNKVISSALMALQSDILIAQALPAGYTYLYIPWPRPVYPSDSTYFYNVNMLAFDRLTFVEDCSLSNYHPHSETYDGKYPASMSYDWQNGSNTPWRTPYWFDYHYMNNMTHIDSVPPDNGSWPIHESGEYYTYDVDDSKVKVIFPLGPNDKRPEIYEPDQKELYDTDSVFPTNCHTHESYRTSEPNRSQRFLFNKHHILRLLSYDKDHEMEVAKAVAMVCNYTNTDESLSLIRQCPVTIPLSSGYTAEKAQELIHAVASYPGAVTIENINEKVYYCSTEIITDTDSIDENEFIDYTDSISSDPGPYRYDVLSKDALIESNHDHHINTYRPFWNEKTPFFDIAQQNTISNEKSSLLSWFNLKQSENRPQLSDSDGETLSEYESVVKDNEPPVSKKTFTSYDRPTVGKLDPLYVGYTRALDDNQGNNKDLSSPSNYLRSAAAIYSYKDNVNVWYDPTISYSLVLKYTDNDGNSEPVYDGEDHSTQYESYAFIEGDPCTGEMYVNLNETRQDVPVTSYNYVTFKKLNIHRLWFSNTKKDVELHEFHNYLYKVKSKQIAHEEGITFCDDTISVYADPIIIGPENQQVQVVGTLNNNQQFTLIDRSAGWIKVSSKDITGWIHSRNSNFGVDELYKYSENTSSLNYNVIGIYNESGELVDYDVARMELFINNDSGSTNYELVCDAHKIEINYSGVIDLNDQWMPVEDTDADNYIVNLINDLGYTVFKSFSNTGVDNNEAIMKMSIYVTESSSIDVKLMGCGEVSTDNTYGCDYPYILVKNSSGEVIFEKYLYNSGATSESATLEEYAHWNDIKIAFNDLGKYNIIVSYRKDGSNHYGLDRAYFAVKTDDLNKKIVKYTRLTAAYVDFTVSRSNSPANDDSQIYLPSNLGDGMWDPNSRQLYPKYIPSRSLIYGDESNWWLPRDEYIKRGYSFTQTQ